MSSIHWSGGDPTPLGWMATAAYLLAAASCAAVWLRLRPTTIAAARERRLWCCLGVLLLALGVNKQSDLQTLLVQVGREAAHRAGVFEFRRAIQAVFFAATAVAVAVCCWRRRRDLRDFALRHATAAAGIGAIAAYVVVRFAAFSHLEPSALATTDDAVRYGFLEIAGNLLVVYAAIRAAASAEEPA